MSPNHLDMHNAASSQTLSSHHTHAFAASCELAIRQGLGQSICHVVICAAVDELYLLACHSLTSKVVMHVDVLGAEKWPPDCHCRS